MHVSNILSKLFVLSPVCAQKRCSRSAVVSTKSSVQRSCRSLHEGMRSVGIEGVDAEAEGAQGNS